MTRALRDFPGGIQLAGNKGESTSRPSMTAPLPRRVVIPLDQHIGEPARPVVKPGQRVRTGELIGSPEGYLSAGVHASITGEVEAVEERPVPHPSGLPALCVVIAGDGTDEWIPAAAQQTDAMSRGALRRRLREAGIVGLGGAAFPTAVKVNTGPESAVEQLILNGAECEPYISCDEMLMRERAGAVVDGALLLMRALDTRQCLIGVEDNKPEAIETLSAAISTIAAEGVEVVPVPTRYPGGGEKQLIYTLTGKEVPSHGLPADVGVVCQNVGTAAAVHDALRHGRPLVERYVTITGPGVAGPGNVRARIGTPMHELIALCGGYTGDPDRLIMGGPMMGFGLSDDDLPVVKGTNCLLVTTETRFPRPDQAMPCIRCGACTEVCPAGLLPQQLYWHARAKDLDRVRDYDLFDCIECGACAYVCPSHIPLVQYYRFAKSEVRAQEEERHRADIARQRYELRQARLEREQREREEKRQRKKAALREKEKSTEDRKAAVQAALQRKRGEAGTSSQDTSASQDDDG
ncbi:electron transport complex subunit RsxC [Ectothiorhodospiraceae bacterium WFHF3C12]|nr:electron transport complex subunit RsxC [Ectothiorhodospiraceae bacterium WFHF3C12]